MMKAFPKSRTCRYDRWQIGELAVRWCRIITVFRVRLVSFENITLYTASERNILLFSMYHTWFLMSDLKEQHNCVNVFLNYYNNNNKFPRVTLQNFRDVSTNKFKLKNTAYKNSYSFNAVFVGSAMMRTQNFEWLLQFWIAEISFDDCEFSGRSFTVHTEET
jgi:hypothetical protein